MREIGIKNFREKRRFVISSSLIFILTTLLCSSTNAQPELKTGLDNLLRGFPKNGSGGVVVIIDKNNVIYSGAYGFANIEWQIPNAMDVKYRIGSLTKSFTAIAILQLADNGKLSIQDKVKKWLPDLLIDEKITIQHLLSHTSGIIKNKKETEFTPGEKMNYSNYGYMLLGEIITKASKMTYNEYLNKMIFSPLGMNSTGYEHYKDILSKKASGYRIENNGSVPAPCSDIEDAGAAGGLYSTPNDLVIFEKSLNGNSAIKKSILDLAFTPFRLNNGQSSSYGYGFMLRDYRGWREVSHGGDIEGFNCYFAHFPDKQKSIIVLQNMKMNIGAPWSEAGRLVDLLVDLIWGNELQPVQEVINGVTVQVEKLKNLTGTYEFVDAPNEMITTMGNKVTVTVEDGKLFLQNKNNKASVIPISETEFAAQDVDIKIRFSLDDKGKGNGLTYILMKIREITAVRIN